MAGDDLHMTFTLGPTEISRNLGYDNFRLAFQVTIGRTLTMQLTVGNDAAVPLVNLLGIQLSSLIGGVLVMIGARFEPASFR